MRCLDRSSDYAGTVKMRCPHEDDIPFFARRIGVRVGREPPAKAISGSLIIFGGRDTLVIDQGSVDVDKEIGPGFADLYSMCVSKGAQRSVRRGYIL